MHLARAGVAQHLHDFHGRRPAHDRIVDQRDAFAGDGRAIGAGKPGPATQRLTQLFCELTAREGVQIV